MAGEMPKPWQDYIPSILLKVEEELNVIEAMRYYRDRAYQGLMNNMWDNNPGELDRWADDGGAVL